MKPRAVAATAGGGGSAALRGGGAPAPSWDLEGGSTEDAQQPATPPRSVGPASRPSPSLEEQKGKRLPPVAGRSMRSVLSRLCASVGVPVGLLLLPRPPSLPRGRSERRLPLQQQRSQQQQQRPSRQRRWRQRRLQAAPLLAWLVVALAVLGRNWWTGRTGLDNYPFQPVDWPPRKPARRASLQPLVVRNESADACAQALGSPKVALLFLTLGTLPHELTWRKWFRSAEGLLPVGAMLRSGACGLSSTAGTAGGALAGAASSSSGRGGGAGGGRPGGSLERLLAACAALPQAAAAGGRASAILGRQHLFSVYVHVPPGFPAFPSDSLFGAEGIQISERVPTHWGTHTLVEATRALLLAAAADPANQRFVLVSESDLPLYDPLTFYQQLMNEGQSRVNACLPPPGDDAYFKTSGWRWTSAMRFPAAFWRKSSQWFTLIRSHAEAILQDTEIFRAFEEHCWSGWVPEYYRRRDCFSDEHYLPTLLAVKGLEAGCACEAWSGPAYIDWTGMKAHPRTFMPADVNSSLIRLARGEGTWQDCRPVAAQREAGRMFVAVEELAERGSRARLCARLAAAPPPAYTHPLKPICALTARKFHNSTVASTHALFKGCAGERLGLLGPRYRRSTALGCGGSSGSGSRDGRGESEGLDQMP